jgi:hypothetical protein
LALKIDARVLSIPLHDQSDLFIDFAFIKGTTNEELVIHISGTHGVEGFAGSAVQRLALDNILRGKYRPRKSLLMIHALNVGGNDYCIAISSFFTPHNLLLMMMHCTFLNPPLT